jgi:hypothetical protein
MTKCPVATMWSRGFAIPETAAKHQKITAQYGSSARVDGSFGEYLTKAIMLSIIKISNNA